ncbi:YqgQ family protein [Oceanobacillus damuensis]|uniref:YqgQ family protein n=1 Tax=Oceanobacillus damuensis TaxID=937928 RepID=UPI000836579F|nr:YqgQ family protein [Oceanobacillus damuensis]
MKTVYDIQQLLKKYGTFIYTGDRIGDLALMEMEIDELYEMKFLETYDFQMAKLILKKEKNRLLLAKERFIHE